MQTAQVVGRTKVRCRGSAGLQSPCYNSTACKFDVEPCLKLKDSDLHHVGVELARAMQTGRINPLYYGTC